MGRKHSAVPPKLHMTCHFKPFNAGIRRRSSRQSCRMALLTRFGDRLAADRQPSLAPLEKDLPCNCFLQFKNQKLYLL